MLRFFFDFFVFLLKQHFSRQTVIFFRIIYRSLLNEIRKLKQEHEEAIKNAQKLGCDPSLLTELRVLRQRKDELEMRMSALQETRRELMVQLEGLMKLLKVSHFFSLFFFYIYFNMLY